MIINLNNLEELEMIMLEYDNVETLEGLVKRKSIKDSMEATDIVGFQEIKDLNNISFGHFILIEKILELKIKDADKLRLVSPVIFRPLGEPQIDNEDAVKENKHKESVLETIPIGAIYNGFNRFMELRHKYLYKTYNGVIYGTYDPEEKEEEKEEGTSINTGTSARNFHTKKFFWNSMISDIAQGDIFKFDKVVDLMMYVVMPYLAEKRSLSIVEYLEHKASMA